MATATNSNWKLLLLGSISGSPLNCSLFHGPFWYTELPTTTMAPARVNELAMFPEHGEDGPSWCLHLHGLDGTYLMNKSKWPKLVLTSAKEALDSDNLEVLTQDVGRYSLWPTAGRCR